MNFEKTYFAAKARAIKLMQQGSISAYIQALQDLKDLQQLRAIGLPMQRHFRA
ncbi:MAG: hypothetical protein LC670_10385 [Flavobacteriales bacterium]|nr:hypothetical protein [Flavobacteriales bacterium]